MSLSNRPIPYNYSEICMYEEAMQSKQYENDTHVNVPPFTGIMNIQCTVKDIPLYTPFTVADPGFQVRGGTLKKIAPSRGRCENVWGISCEKSRFYAKKT